MACAATRILVVDDFRAFRQWVRAKLESQGKFHIEEAADATEAICKSQELKPDLILLDIGLPQLSGIDTYKEISRIVHSTPAATRIHLSFLTVVTCRLERHCLKHLGFVSRLVKSQGGVLLDVTWL
jgi:CheY-like chemotaxis protein